ncbi:hypothetical protein HYPSUDRAFT_204658 [Hypholoma sublateritium FD-334 SS-4]|uniref:F-box domain-containing protein n=1 Tax=Hypholoma sublateritium (strain FD-334 SS-4) TaxID=945553 RepID=A0A0D2KY37_HYPSF|nr:hypothetical protein HYPSUDRAFT_204658 [Hypholoma sublateritium FD-334 SS-4]
MTSLRINQLIIFLRVNPRLATYISEITTSTQQFVPHQGLDHRLAFLLFRIKQISPHSSLDLEVRPHDTDLVPFDTTSTRFVAPPAQMACLSLVTSLKLVFVGEFPSILLFYLTNVTCLKLKIMDFHPALDTFESPRLVQLATSLCRSITTLSIKNSEENGNQKFPGILIASCHSLERLVLDAVTFTDDMVLSASPRPKITFLELADFRYDMVKTLVDFLVDLSEIYELVDFTEPQDREEFTSKEYNDIVEALRYLLNASKGSLVNLRLLHCVSASSETKPSIFDLSQIPNLTTLGFTVQCVRAVDHIKAAVYLRNNLLTLSPQTQKVDLYLEFVVLMEHVATDSNGVAHLDFSTLPLIFRQSAWSDIKRLMIKFAERATRQPFSFSMHVRNRDYRYCKYKYMMAPTNEGAIFDQIVRQWTTANLLPNPPMPNLDFYCSTYPGLFSDRIYTEL